MGPLADGWRPWRAIAARLLWTYYRAVKNREGVLLQAAKPASQTGRERSEARMAGEIDGPRLAPKSGPARQLIVFVHGYGADGNDLIEIGRAWQLFLPHAAFVSPHAPHPCGQAPMGREWFPLTFRDPDERWTASTRPRPARAIPRCRASRATSFRRPRSRWSAFLRAP